jgi:transcriptional regulator with XRE-family HTH domain
MIDDLSATQRLILAVQKARGYDDTQLAEALGVSRHKVSRWRRGVLTPPLMLPPALRELLRSADVPQDTAA